MSPIVPPRRYGLCATLPIIFYTAVNGYHYEHGEPSVSIPIWQTIAWIVVGMLGVMLVVLEVIAIKRFLSRRKENSLRMLAQSPEQE